jgi:type VI secretion system protein ImpH
MTAGEAAETNNADRPVKADLRWGSGASARDRLYADASPFSFYQAVRILSILKSDAAPQLHHDSVPVRFRSRMGFEFPGADIDRLLPAADDRSFPEMLVNFLALAGAHGPLPSVYTEQLLMKEKSALADFLDIFNHRLIVLLYRVHEMHHPALTPTSPDKGLAANHLYAFFGLGCDPTSAARDQLSLPDRALLDYAGLLAHRPHSASGLQTLLSDYFQVEVAIEQFTGGWLNLSEDQWTRLGVRQGQNQELGDGAILGKRVWEQHAGVTICLGPLDLNAFESFLPNGGAHPALCDLCSFYLGQEWDFSFRLELRSDQIPWPAFSAPRPGVRPPALGRLAWLRSDQQKSGAPTQDALSRSEEKL